VKIECSLHIFEIYLNIKFYENPCSDSRVVPCGQTDRHDVAISRFVQLCERWLRFLHLERLKQELYIYIYTYIYIYIYIYTVMAAPRGKTPSCTAKNNKVVVE